MRKAAAVLIIGFSVFAAWGAGNAAMQTVLPSGWRLSPAAGPIAETGTMPQGVALSPDGKTLAVVESGTRPPALRLLDSATLSTRGVVALTGAFGKPVWTNDQHVLVAGANADAIFDIDVSTLQSRTIPTGSGSWPVGVALLGNHLAIADDYDNATGGSVTLGDRNAGSLHTVAVGAHPAGLAFSADGSTLYVALRGESSVAVVDVASQRVEKKIAVGRHPADVALSADGAKLYVAVSDEDAVAVIATRSNVRTAQISVALKNARASGSGANPNALLVAGNTVFVSLGGLNAVAIMRNGRILGDVPAGWYPTGIAASKSGTLFVSNGKGERSPPNPQFNPMQRRSGGYVADMTNGSVRAIPQIAYANAAHATNLEIADVSSQWQIPAATVLRSHGPISHVIYVIKENRSFDQILGDVPGGNGDVALAMFGRNVTPNQHALAQRFGLFDNAYADAQVSADGHNWTDAANANDYVERMWPPNYGRRRQDYDFQDGTGADVPPSGYLWDAAKRAGITYRDYGEDTDYQAGPVALAITDHPALAGHFDTRYIGWNLRVSDLVRLAEWKNEFAKYVATGNLPQLEIVYLPNDHTSGAVPGVPAPAAFIGTNDWAVGQLVETVSHSPYWKSAAIFVLEDDAQNGPDHVSAQRSTFYVASPYARGGIDHTHYSTVSVVRSIELLLGLRPLSIHDATAQPMYSAFVTARRNSAPFDAVKPSTDLAAKNLPSAYGAAVSARLDFTHPDAADSRVLNDILQHAGKR